MAFSKKTQQEKTTMNRILFFAGLLCACSIIHIEAAQNASNENYKTSVELSQGYRRDNLNIKLNHNSSKTKQHFKNLDVYTSRVGVTVEKDDCFMKGVVGYGNVYDGKLHQHNNGHHSSSNVHGDYTADFAITLGKNMRYSEGWSVAPTVGYGVYVQDFHTGKHHHNQSKQKVKATWYSPQAGLSVQKTIADDMNVYATYMCLFPLSYQGKTNHGHGSQENKAYKSIGNIVTLGMEWTFASNWSLRPEIEVMKFYSKGGDSGHKYKFKHADRSAAEFRVVLGYMF